MFVANLECFAFDIDAAPLGSTFPFKVVRINGPEEDFSAKFDRLSRGLTCYPTNQFVQDFWHKRTLEMDPDTEPYFHIVEHDGNTKTLVDHVWTAKIDEGYFLANSVGSVFERHATSEYPLWTDAADFDILAAEHFASFVGKLFGIPADVVPVRIAKRKSKVPVGWNVYVGTTQDLVSLFRYHPELTPTLLGLEAVEKEGITIHPHTREGVKMMDKEAKFLKWDLEDPTPMVLYMKVADCLMPVITPLCQFMAGRVMKESP